MARLRTLNQAAEILKEEDPNCKLGRTGLRTMAKAGRIPVVHVTDKKVLVDIDTLERFFASAEVPAQKESGIRQIRV